MWRAFQATLQEAAEAGLVAPEIDARIAARLLFGLVNSLTEWVRPGSDPAVVADTLVTIAFHGLFTSAPSRQP